MRIWLSWLQYGQLEPYTSLSTLTALDACTAENGAVVLLPGAHKRGQVLAASYDAQRAKTASQGADVIKTEVDTSGARQLELAAGQVLIMHCHMLHASPPNLSEHPRRVLFQRYADADATEVYNDGAPRLGRLVYGRTRFREVDEFEATDVSWRESVAESAESHVTRELARRS